MSSSTFLSLPTEILDVILRESPIPLRTLAGLAQTAPILTPICVSIYLERNGITKPEEACTLLIRQSSTEFDTLSALSLAGWVTETRRFECHFEGRNGDFTAMLSQLARLRALLGRFTSLGKVVFNFDPQDRIYAGLSDDDMATWSDAMGGLLSGVVERGCTALEVNGLRQMCDVYHGILLFPQRPSSVTQLTSFLDAAVKGVSRFFSNSAPEGSQCAGTILCGPTWGYRRDETKSSTHARNQHGDILAHLSDAAKDNSKLAHLKIGSKSMLCPPLLQWTCSVLESSPITSLAIHGVEFMGHDWTILSILIPRAIPSLRHLELSQIGFISHGQITDFMAAFPKLKYLSVDGLDLPWYTALSGLGTVTPQLISLTPFLEDFRVHIIWILPNMEFNANALPALRTLTIVCGEGFPTGTGVAPPLLMLSQRSKELKFDLNMEIRASSDIIPWMRRTVLPNDERLLEFFRCISGIVLVVKERLEFEHEPSKKWVKAAAEEWFEQFPALREAGIRTEVDSLDGEISRIQKFYKQVLPDVRKRLRRLHVNGQTAY